MAAGHRILGLFLALTLAGPLLLSAAPPLFVATDENLPPFSFVEDGQAAGIDVDMLQEVARRTGRAFTVEARPWKRVLTEAESGQAPLAMPLFRTPEREAFAILAGPVHFSTFGLFVRKDRTFRYDRLEDLYGRRIGINQGFAISSDLDRAVREGRIACEAVGSTEQNLRKLLAGRIDAFLANLVNTEFLLRRFPARDEVVALPRHVFARRPAFLVVSRAAELPDKERLAEELGAALDQLAKDGTYDRIVARYVR